MTLVLCTLLWWLFRSSDERLVELQVPCVAVGQQHLCCDTLGPKDGGEQSSGPAPSLFSMLGNRDDFLSQTIGNVKCLLAKLPSWHFWHNIDGNNVILLSRSWQVSKRGTKQLQLELKTCPGSPDSCRAKLAALQYSRGTPLR